MKLNEANATPGLRTWGDTGVNPAPVGLGKMLVSPDGTKLIPLVGNAQHNSQFPTYFLDRGTGNVTPGLNGRVQVVDKPLPTSSQVTAYDFNKGFGVTTSSTGDAMAISFSFGNPGTPSIIYGYTAPIYINGKATITSFAMSSHEGETLVATKTVMTGRPNLMAVSLLTPAANRQSVTHSTISGGSAGGNAPGGYAVGLSDAKPLNPGDPYLSYHIAFTPSTYQLGVFYRTATAWVYKSLGAIVEATENYVNKPVWTLDGKGFCLVIPTAQGVRLYLAEFDADALSIVKSTVINMGADIPKAMSPTTTYVLGSV